MTMVRNIKLKSDEKGYKNDSDDEVFADEDDDAAEFYLNRKNSDIDLDAVIDGIDGDQKPDNHQEKPT